MPALNNEITIHLQTPELVAAIDRLAALLSKNIPHPQMQPAPPQQQYQPQPQPQYRQQPVQQMQQQVPQPTYPQQIQQPAPQPQQPPITGMSYTQEQISAAAAPLMEAGKGPVLTALLARYGVNGVSELKPEMYGNFVTELRALGARI